MLTLLTFHKDESCLSLGTAVPAKKLLIRFPFTGETESGLRGAILTSQTALSGPPLTLCRLRRAELSQAKTLRLSLKKPSSPTAHALEHLCQALLPRRWARARSHQRAGPDLHGRLQSFALETSNPAHHL